MAIGKGWFRGVRRCLEIVRRTLENMFERFTDSARKAIVYAQEEARDLGHNYIGTEHLLLALLHDRTSVASRALETRGITLENSRRRVEEIVGRGSAPAGGHIPFTPRAKKVLELSLRESMNLGHNGIEPEHVLLGLIAEGEGVAAQVMSDLGPGLDQLRREVIRLRSVPTEPMEILGSPPRCPRCGSTVEASLRWRAVSVAGEGDASKPVTVFFCGSCGTTIGVAPGE